MSGQSLHEFMRQHAESLLAISLQHVQQTSPEQRDDELAGDLQRVLDEIVRALERDAGLPVDSPLPGKSEAAARFGGHRHETGVPIAKLASHIGSISEAIGQLGQRHGRAFGAREYLVLNRCIDAVMSAAIDEFWSHARGQLEQITAERIGYLAHELRDALSTARMAFAMLRTGEVGMQSQSAHALERSLARLEQLVDQTLVDVHLRSKVQPRHDPLRVDKLLHELVEATPRERGIAVVLETDGVLELASDERLLASAVGNLLRNAMKFTRKQGHIVLRAHRADRAVVIEVEDECGGLRHDPAELFEPHVQGVADRRGFGLGLAITREAVEALGGAVFVANHPGKGCTFGLRFPT